MSESNESGQLQNYSVDQAAGAIVLVLGAVASLLLVIWQSRCFCSVNLCYIFRCERRPPNESEMEGLKDQAAKLKASRDKKSADKKSPAKKPPSKKPDEQLIPSPKPKPDVENPAEPEPEPALN